MACKLCGSGRTSKFGKLDLQQTYCHECGGHEFRGLLINKRDWDRWINSESDLVGTEITGEQHELQH